LVSWKAFGGETRSYVKRVLLYHWLYRRRFGQDAKSLERYRQRQLADLSSGHAATTAHAYGLAMSTQ